MNAVVFDYLRIIFPLVSQLYILTSSSCAASLCIPTSSWLALHTPLYLIMICYKNMKAEFG